MNAALWFAVVVIAFYALVAFAKYVPRIGLRPRLTPMKFNKLVGHKMNKEIDATITKYDRFKKWLAKEHLDIILTDPQQKACEAWLNGIEIEELDKHINAFDKHYIANLIKQYENH